MLSAVGGAAGLVFALAAGFAAPPAVEVAAALGFELVAALDVEPLTAGLVSGLKGGGGWWGLAGIGFA